MQTKTLSRVSLLNGRCSAKIQQLNFLNIYVTRSQQQASYSENIALRAQAANRWRFRRLAWNSFVSYSFVFN